ncbi:MAG: peptidylprolyl isomerase [Eubacterium sp.]
MKKLTGIIVAATALSMCFIFTGCNTDDIPVVSYFTVLEDNQIFRIGDNILTTGEAAIALSKEQVRFETSYGSDVWTQKAGDITMEQYVKDIVKDDLAIDYMIASMADDYDIELDDNESEQVCADAEEYFNTLQSTSLYGIDITLEDAYSLYTTRALADKVYNSITEGKVEEISDEEARVITIEYIYMGISDDKKDEEVKASIDDVYDIVEAGNQDFIVLVNKYTEGITQDVVISRDDMSDAFNDEVFKLSDNEISPVFAADNGYYIVKCINSYMEDETARNKEQMEQQEKENYFAAQYDSYLKEVKTKFNDDAWNSLSILQDQ